MIATAIPGQMVTYTVNVTNNGNQAGTNLVITDTFPTNVLENVASVGGTIDALAGTITWTLPTLVAGGSQIFTVTADVIAPAGAGIDDFTNLVSVVDDGANGVDPNPADNSDSDTDTLNAVPDLTITKDDVLTNGSTGESILYTITVRNVGDQDATGVTVSDVVPVDTLTNVIASDSGIVDGVAGTIDWTLGNVAGGQTVVLTVTADVRSTLDADINDLTNTVSVSDDNANGVDPTPGDNSDSDIDIVDAEPDYEITKTDALTDATTGDPISYTITVRNIGDQTGTNVVVDDLFPNSVLENVTADNGGVVDAGAGSIHWDLGTLAAGATVVLTVDADVRAAVPAGIDDFTNSVTVGDDGTNGVDPNSSNNTDDDTDILHAAPDYIITKTDGLTNVEPGDSITYTITVDNDGTQDGTNIVITDSFPISGLTNVVASDAGVVDAIAGTITWTFASNFNTPRSHGQ
jgi:uncharacterized repeat protein (TIGR01451 family)